MEKLVPQNKRLLVILLTVTTFLLIPLVAMQFTNEVNWSVFDFLVAGILLFGTGLAIEIIARTVKNKKSRIVLFIVITILLVLLWLELAVGIFGTPIAGS